jgi:hypothetical protein
MTIPLDSLAAALAAGDHAPLDALFATAGLPPPRIAFDPSEAQMPTDALKFLLRHCRELPQAHGLPLYQGVDVATMRPALGYLTLLDLVDGGRDFRYRVFGTRLSERLPFDLTGKCVSENPDPTMARYFVALNQATVARRVPAFAQHVPPANVEVEYWQRLVVPLADADGTVVRLLNGNVAGPWRKAESG